MEENKKESAAITGNELTADNKFKKEVEDKDTKKIIQSKQETSYLSQRLSQLGITEKENIIEVLDRENRPNNQNLFSEDKDGNIKIFYLTPDGHQCEYDNNGKLRQYYRKRFKSPETEGKRYWQPVQSGVFPYLTPGIIEKYKKSIQIKDLFIVEGEFKAIAGSLKLGLDFIGIGGIHKYKDKTTGEIDDYIKQIIEVCQVKNIVLLFDADTLKIEYEQDKDLYKRPNLFYAAVRNFKELLKPYNIDVYFSHILEKYQHTGKGLDDLLNLPDIDKEKLKDELLKFTAGSKREYIKTLLISENSISALRKYFCIDNVTCFYNRYADIINNNEFLFNNKKYSFDEQAKKLKISWYNQANQYLRVGATYYKIATLINAHKEKEQILQEWNKGEISTDYNDKEFLKQIPKYDLFCNIPENKSENYKRIHVVEDNGFKTVLYNRYSKLEHEIKSGNFPNIEKLLKHLFSQTNLKGEPLYEFGLDYIQLLYINPCQRLPVLCMVSRERNTGKSTFLDFLRAIFKENMTILDNERFAGKFTSHYIDKLIIAIDETFIDVEKALIKERIKNLCIGKRQWLEAKGRNAQELEIYSKIILCSNNENNFLQIDDGENRFAVCKVPVLTNDDPFILDKIKKEIPFFLNYLLNRKLKYEIGISRFSFAQDVYMTEQMQNVQELTKTRFEKEFREFIKDKFFSLQLARIELAPLDICKELNENSSFRYNKTQIIDYLKYEKKMCPSKGAKVYKLYSMTEINGTFQLDDCTKRGRVYTFNIDEWLTKKEIENIEIENNF